MAYFIAVKVTLILKDDCKHVPSMKLPSLRVEQLVRSFKLVINYKVWLHKLAEESR